MALRLRRGTDLERQAVIFAEGELVYTTDTKSLFVGDGVTLGGILISGDLTESPDVLTRNMNLNNYDITGTGDITITGIVTATKFVGDGSQLVNLPNVSDIVDGGFYSINVVGADSSIILNRDTNTVTGNFVGDLTGSLRGSVFGDDSSIIVNSATNEIYGKFIGDGSLLTNVGIVSGGSYNINIVGADSSIIVDSSNNSVNVGLINFTESLILDNDDSSLTKVIIKGNNNLSTIKLQRHQTGVVDDSMLYGRLDFEKHDAEGSSTKATIGADNGGIFIAYGQYGVTFDESTYVVFSKNSNLGVGTFTPSEKLDVRGNVKASGFVQFGNLTTVQRDALTPVNGMVIYNTTNNKFEGYQNGGWINLDTGVAAS
jgi:hypothetical protein